MNLIVRGARRAVLAGVLVWTLVLAASLVTSVTPVLAQGGDFSLPEGVTWDQVNAIARKMYCDVCEGVPLDECESIACRQWREEIARQLGDGRTENEIIDLFVERYGADVAALPRNTRDRVLVFAVPILMALAIGVIGGMQVQQMRRRGQQPGQVARRSMERLQGRPLPDDIEQAYLDRLQAELGELDT